MASTARLGINTIFAKRIVELDRLLTEKMEETKPKFLFDFFGTEPRYASSIEALEALKQPRTFVFFPSAYLQVTRYAWKGDESRLKMLERMSYESVDTTMWINPSDFELLFKYASPLEPLKEAA